ncbi:MAG: CotH kinase family protein [Candidatus Hatepunaea meridiana]|nr:CotH kinase family protein [Candidatus Hatepunaea meridiana]
MRDSHRYLQTIFYVIFLCIFPITAFSDPELTLPVYKLDIDPSHLDALNSNPWTSRTFPAQFEYEGSLYDCHIRYRGASARDLDKKSWKIYFDADGPGGRQEINLNSEYRDRSYCRNYLVMELSRYVGLPTPNTRFISLMVNNLYHGVHIDVEPVDEDFLDRNNLGFGALWKALQHGARFTPLVRYEDISKTYEPKISPTGALDTLGARFTYINFADIQEIANGISDILDVDNFLNYFAVQYFTNNGDGYTKNYFLFKKPDSRWILTPWDCDASLGNDWHGEWIDHSHFIYTGFLDHQTVFQRLISLEDNRARMLEIVHNMATFGSPYLIRRLNETYDEIRHDVYLDNAKKCSNEEFEQERERLQYWFDNRANHLRDLDWFNRMELVSYSVEPEYLSSSSDIFRIEVVMSQSPYKVKAYIIDSNGTEHQFDLLDDGSNGDETAGDLIFTRDITLPDQPAPFYYGIYIKPNEMEGYPTPPSGWACFSAFPTPLPVIRVAENPPQQGDFGFTSFYEIQQTGTHYFGIVNRANHPVDISGCIIKLCQVLTPDTTSDNSYKKMQLRELPPLNPSDTLIITNHIDIVSSMFPDCQVTGNFYFPPVTTDTIYLETYGGKRLASQTVGQVDSIEETSGLIVINEINYNSAVDFNPGDWIELYCRRGEIDVGNWVLRDNREDHSYVIPSGTTIREGEYLIIARDWVSFNAYFPNVTPVIGEFNFGFSGTGDDVRLFDSGGTLIDWVSYDDNDPWPTQADGEGPTLELINPMQPNYGHEFWRASTESFPNGTPGRINSTFREFDDTLPLTWGIENIYPNPFNCQVFIRWSQYAIGYVHLSVYDLAGRELQTITNGRYPTGYHTISWQAGELPAGMYFVKMEHIGRIKFEKIVHLK